MKLAMLPPLSGAEDFRKKIGLTPKLYGFSADQAAFLGPSLGSCPSYAPLVRTSAASWTPTPVRVPDNSLSVQPATSTDSFDTGTEPDGSTRPGSSTLFATLWSHRSGFGNDSRIGISMFNPVAEVHHHVPELSEKPEDVAVLAPLAPLLRVVV